MWQCGENLEKVKAEIGATNRYVFTGGTEELLTEMHYCKETKPVGTKMVDRDNVYRVPAGTVGWLAPDGRGVLEGCANRYTCKGCKLAGPRASPVLLQYALQINFMADRPDGYWLNRYEDAKAKREANLMRSDVNNRRLPPYFEVFTEAPFGGMLAERKSRPLDGRFLARFLKKGPVLDIRPNDSLEMRRYKYEKYMQEFQSPPESNVLTWRWASTDSRGWVIVPITVALSEFEVVLVQPEQIGQVIEPVIEIPSIVFQAQSNPIHVWEVRR